MNRLFFLLFFPLLCSTGVAIALDNDRDQPATVTAQDIEIDFDTGRRIYRGNVKIQQGTLHMTADEIHLFFKDDVLERAIAHGRPATFQQMAEGNNGLIRGRAQKIEIDEIEKVMIFSGAANLQQQNDTIMGKTIIFHMENEKMQCLADCQMTVRDDAALPDQTEQSSTKNNIGTNLIDKSDQNRNSDDEEPKTSDNTLQFRAARVLSAGTAAYSGPNATSALLGGLSGRMPVKVLAFRDNWARVITPGGINVWVFSSYVVKDSNGGARIKGRGVRARSLPSRNSRIVGIFQTGTLVRIHATQDDWKQVSLPSSIATWVPVTQLEILEGISPEWQNEWAAQVGVLPGTEN